MQFIALETEEQLKNILGQQTPQIILKHNSTCSISKGVLERLKAEAADIPQVTAIHVLDLLQYRSLSNAIAASVGVPHQSPQLLLIREGRCIYHEWGFDISAEAAADAVEVQG